MNTDKIEKLQRRAARAIIRSDSSDEAPEYLGYDTLQRRRKKHVIKLVKKCLNKRCLQFLIDYFKYNRKVLSRRTRQSEHLRLPPLRLDCTKKAFYYHDCLVFNRNN